MTELATRPAGGVLVEVLRNQFMGVVRELGQTIRNAGHTVFVKETSDFGAYLVSPGGEVFMTPDDMGIFITIGTPFATAIEAIEDYRDGDICVTNDPETSGGMVTHLPDVFMWTPIFAPGSDRPLCFAFCFIHATDIGGLVPGSVSPGATDMFQEGFILPPSKLVAHGVLNTELAAILRANTRVPNLNWGDFRAEISALGLSRRRMGELVARYGAETIAVGIEGVLDYAERQARSIIEGIPDGTYSFADYLEADFAEPRPPIRIALDLTVRGSDLVLDFSRTDPQVPLALNLATYGKAGHNMLVPGLVNYFRSRMPDITYNSGMVRPVDVVAPRGSLLNPEPRAPVGARQATMFRVPDVILGALSQAVPDQVPACGGGQGAVMLVAAPEFDTGTERVSILQPLIGGSGGGPVGDGIDGVDFVAGFYRNIPTEVLESDVPVLVERYELRESGGGAGRARGGLGLAFSVRVLAPRATLTCRGMERTRFQPWGRSGGQPGQPGTATLHTAGGTVRELGKIDVLEVGPGEVLEVRTPGGAGFGDPLERSVEAVVADVADGFVDVETAKDRYGVVFTGGRVDRAGTASLRARRRSRQVGRPRPPFDLGPERTRFESCWTPELQDALNAALWRHPAGLRSLLRDLAHRRLDGRVGLGTPDVGHAGRRGTPLAPADVGPVVDAIVDDLRTRLYR